MKSYIINSSTMALINDNSNTLVYETDDTFIVNKAPLDIIKESCLFYFSTFDGRLQASKNILNSYYKIPIVIEESNGIVFFPTSSVHDKNNNWFSINYVNNVLKFGSNSIVKMLHEVSINCNFSKFSFERQMLKASRLLLVLNQRKL